MIRDIHLHGHLSKFVGEKVELDCETACEAIRAIGFQVPAFVDALAEGDYVLIRGNEIAKGISLDIEQAIGFRLGNAALHIIPVAEGSGGGRGGGETGAWIKIIAGAVLVGAAIFMSGGALGASMGFMGLSYGNMAFVGLTLALLGVSKLLADTEDKKKKEKQSYMINGPSNTYTQGGPVPVIYGEVMTGSVTVSAASEIGDNTYPTIGEWVIISSSGWQNLTAALTLETLRVRIDIEDSTNCGGTNSNTQAVTLHKTLTLEGGQWRISVASMLSMVEEQNEYFELMDIYIDNTKFYQARAWDRRLGCSSAPAQVLLNNSVTMDKGEHTLKVVFTTGDGQYHKDAYYDITFDLDPL